MPLHIDFETRSELDLSEVGVYRYAEHPSTEVLCMAWAFHDGPVQLWRPGMAFPNIVATYEECHAWNAQFERVIWNAVLRRQVPLLMEKPIRYWHCTMADALSMGLPGKLERCAKVLLGPDGEQKDAKGHALMLRMSKPRTVNPTTWWEDEERLAKLYDYCRQDVVVEREIARHLRPLSPAERKLWLLDQTINDRGVRLDLPLVAAAKEIAEEATTRANLELSGLTKGALSTITQNTALASYLGMDSVAKDAVASALARTDLAPDHRRILELRYETAMSSAAKLDGMRAMACADGRVRGTMQYHAAHTGRWGGRGIQPQNFPRGVVDNAYDLIPLIQRGRSAYDTLHTYCHPLHAVSSVLRAMLVPSKGKQFASYDYSAIEPRVTAWLAGQQDALDRYHAGEDEYWVMASEIYGLSRSQMTKYPHRQLAKAVVLGAIFGLGWKGLQRAAAKAPYFLDIDEAMASRAVEAFRAKWYRVPEFWRNLESAVLECVRVHGAPVTVGKLACIADRKWLLVKLPSGRLLTYARPTIRNELMPWGKYKDVVFAEGENSLNKKWESYSLWGGFLTENFTQAVARDVMANRLPVLEEAGILPVLSVHDELVAEVSSHDEYVRMGTIMQQTPTWAAGLPIAVEGWMGSRYQK